MSWDVVGWLDLERMSIPCPIELDDCRLAQGISVAGATLALLSLPRTHIGSEDLAAGAAVAGIGVTIKGLLRLYGATLINPGGDALVLDAAHVTGNVLLNHAFTAHGGVRAPGARFGGQLNVGSAALFNPDGEALTLNDAHITGNLFMDAGFTAEGEVRALGATVGGQLVLSTATLRNPTGHALTLDGARIDGNVFMDDGFSAEGEVRAHGATIGGQFALSAAHLSNPSGDALTLDRVQLAGSLFMDNGFTAEGEVRAVGATISGQINLRDATLLNPEMDALSLEGTHAGMVFLDSVTQIEGIVNLASSQIETLICPANGRPPGALISSDWSLRFVRGEVGEEPKTAQAWLDTRPEHCPFTPQSGRELADMFERTGHPDRARAMRHQAAQGIARRSTGWNRVRLWAYNMLAGHGYYPHRVIGWLAVILAVAVFVTVARPQWFEPADYPKAMTAARTVAVQTSSTAPQPLTGATPCPQLGTYPCFPRITYALQTVIPPATAITTTAWQPANNTTLALFTTLKAIGWILVVLFLASITGLLKRT